MQALTYTRPTPKEAHTPASDASFWVTQEPSHEANFIFKTNLMLQTLKKKKKKCCPAKPPRKPSSLRVGGGPLRPPFLAASLQRAQPWFSPEQPHPTLCGEES